MTGAFDDASASYFGNLVVTDNLKRRILRRFRVVDAAVVTVFADHALRAGLTHSTLRS